MAATSTLLPSSDTQAAVAWLRARGVRRLVSDSRQVMPGDAFVAWPGFVQDGRRYVPDALAAGAAAAVVEAEGADAFGFDVSQVLPCMGLKSRAGELASLFDGEPSRALKVVAVTGTNGKTSTAWWTAQALAAAGMACGLVGTLGIGRPGALSPTGLTTPDPVTFQRALREFANTHIRACAVEASSIGLVEHRLHGTHIAVAQFTNFTQDHLDFHGSMDAYWRAKAMLFDWPGLQAAVVNVDDPRGAELAQRLAGRPGFHLVPYAVGAGCATAPKGAWWSHGLMAQAVRHENSGLSFDVVEAGQRLHVQTRLVGDFNVANLLAVLGALRCLGVSLTDGVTALSALTAVPGRMERVDLDDTDPRPVVVVDYAHTPDALQKALQTLRPLAQSGGGALRVVFGCGGDRDRSKRPLMGGIAGQLADQVWLTTDNPRSEDPQLIAEQTLAGIEASARRDRVIVDLDRASAICQAVHHSSAGDVVLLAGKGHETYQDAAGVRTPFSDVAEAKAALRSWRLLEGAA
jgi:UDP-N-acetylmuramoyl-L-alanyl-D-glutamate--2,6-diaminopimelate ligase